MIKQKYNKREYIEYIKRLKSIRNKTKILRKRFKNKIIRNSQILRIGTKISINIE